MDTRDDTREHRRRLNFRDVYTAVKKLDLRATLQRRGYEIGNDGFFKENPIRSERTPSIRIRSDDRSRWHDFGEADDGQTDGDLIDLLRLAEHMSHVEAVREAARIVGILPSDPAPRVNQVRRRPEEGTVKPSLSQPTPQRDLTELVNAASHALKRGTSVPAQEARAYLSARGLDPHGAVIREARVGVLDDSVSVLREHAQHLQGRLLLPYLDLAGTPTFYSTRTLNNDAARSYRKQAGGHATVPYNLPSIRGAKTVIVVEGELDALSIMTALGPQTAVIATGGGRLKDDHLPVLSGVDSAYLLFDSDERGQAFSRATEALLRSKGVAVTQMTQMEDTKDPNEALARHGPDALRTWLSDQLQGAPTRGDLEYLRGGFFDALERIRAGSRAAYSTGIPSVDALLDGGYRSGLHLVGGLTGIGKTGFALSLALSTALAGRDVIYMSLEQSKFELWSRLISARTGVPLAVFKDCAYAGEHGPSRALPHELRDHQAWPDLELAAAHLRVIESGDAPSGADRGREIRDLAAEVRAVTADTGTPPLVIVDYIQRMSTQEAGGLDARQRVGHNVGLLQVMLVRELDCAVVALSSVSRAHYNTSGNTGPEDHLASLKESGDLEFTANTVAILHRPGSRGAGSGARRARVHDSDASAIEFSLAKNREGPTGAAILQWNPPQNHWTDCVTKDPVTALLDGCGPSPTRNRRRPQAMG
jgi:replicative DNA helicase/5S rRNA maturation endonuclease (ribonuclease M5)